MQIESDIQQSWAYGTMLDYLMTTKEDLSLHWEADRWKSMVWRGPMAKVSQYDQSATGTIRHTERLGMVEVEGVEGSCGEGKSIWSRTGRVRHTEGPSI